MKRSLLQMMKTMLLGRRQAEVLSVLEEEKIQSRGRMILRSFFSNKLALGGFAVFSTIVIMVFVLSVLFPLDLNYQDMTQQDVPPGYNMAKLPPAMKKNPRDIGAGSIFSVGADHKGNLYVWGQLTGRQKQIPKGADNIVQVSAGLDHMLAVDENGKVYTWGSNRFGLDKIPFEVTQAGPIKQVVAGHQFSLAVSEQGELFFWGNGNLIELDSASIPKEIQYQVDYVTVNSSNVVVLLVDGSLQVLGLKSTPIATQVDKEQRYTQIAVSDQAAIGVTKEGQVVAWGNDFYGLLDVPKKVQNNVKEIRGARFHFTALLMDGSMAAWGRNQFKQAQVPKKLQEETAEIVHISPGYFLNYAWDKRGEVHTFGLKGYLMGTDGSGRDVFRRLVAGGRLTLTVGFVSVLVSVVIGVLIGGIAGYYGGRTDLLLMRLAEMTGAIPFLPLAMTLSVLIGSKVPETYRILLIMIILGVLSWPNMAKLVRGQVLAEREKEFVIAARATGIKELSIIFRYIVPNVMGPIVISATLSYAASMLIESALSFLGFGVAEPNPTWGNMLTGAQSSQVIDKCWWRWVFPCAALCLTTVSINLMGDGLLEAMDPHDTE